MLGRYSVKDNVRVTLHSAINAVASSIVIDAASGVFNNPADPAGDSASAGFGIATIYDSLVQPTLVEIITYESLTDNGNGTLTLGGVSRGIDGTMAQSFAVGAVLMQSMTVSQLTHPLLTADQDNTIVTVNADLTTNGAVIQQDGSNTGFSWSLASGFAVIARYVSGAFKNRWRIGASGAESSGNAGSDLSFSAFDDGGLALNQNALTIKRSSGNVGVNLAASSATDPLTVGGTASATNVVANATASVGYLGVRANFPSAGGAIDFARLRPNASTNPSALNLDVSTDGASFNTAFSVALASGAVSMDAATITALVGTTGKFGAQPTTPPVAGAAFSVAGNGAAAASVTMRFSGDATGANIALAKARGTAASPTIVSNNDVLGQINAYGARTASAWTNGGVISFEADGAQTTTSMPTRIVFKTVAPLSVTPTEVCRFNANNSAAFAGDVSAAGVLSAATLSVSGGGNFGAVLNVGTLPTTHSVTGPLLTATGAGVHANLTATGANATAAALNLAKGRGNGDAVVSNGDEIGVVNWYAYNGTAWFNSGSISSTVDAAVASSAVITSIRFQLSANGTSAPVDVMRVMNDGRVLINGATAVTNVNLRVLQSNNAVAGLWVSATGGLGDVKIGFDATNGAAYIDSSSGLTRILAGTVPAIQADVSGIIIGPTSTLSATAPLDITGNSLRIRTARTPATSSAAGAAGTICWDSNFLYVCVATNSWKRVALTTF